MKFTLKILLLLGLFVFAEISYAQSLLNDTPSDPILSGTIQTSIVPSRPGPNQVVSVSVNSFSVDIDRSVVSWYKNGSLVSSGVGKTNYVYTTGNIGSTDNIYVTVEPSTGSLLEKTLVIKPADVLLLWQSEGYTPPFYRGKSLRTAESSVTVLALPNIIDGGARTNTSSLVFTWEQDGLVLGSRSGVGRDTLVVDGSLLLRPVNVSVGVESLDGTIKTKRSIQIPVSQPTIELYERSPVLGVLFNNAIADNAVLEREELTIEVFPFFFSIADRLSSLEYDWELSGVDIKDSGGPRITVRQGEHGGSVPLSVSVKNSFSLLESSSKETNLIFGL